MSDARSGGILLKNPDQPPDRSQIVKRGILHPPPCPSPNAGKPSSEETTPRAAMRRLCWGALRPSGAYSPAGRRSDNGDDTGRFAFFPPCNKIE